MIGLPASALALFGFINWYLLRVSFAYSDNPIGKFLDDEEDEENEQCAYCWELDEPISLASCKPEFAQCYQSGYDDNFLCEGCSVVEDGSNKHFTETTDADCACTCCWYQYLQNYCFKRLCSDNDEFVRLYEYTKSICDRAPVRKNIRPYRPKDSKGFGNPSDKIDLDYDPEVDDYYVEVGDQSVQLFAADNNKLYRSLVAPEKHELFTKLSGVFDFESLSIDDDFTTHSGTDSGILQKRSSDTSEEKEIHKAVNALRDFKDNLSFDVLQDLFHIYADKADDFFEISRQFLGDEKNEVFVEAFKDSSQILKIQSGEQPLKAQAGRLCLEDDGIAAKYPVIPLPDEEALQFSGCYLRQIANAIDMGLCQSPLQCSCRCAGYQAITDCLQSYAKEFEDLLTDIQDVMPKYCSNDSEENEQQPLDPDTIASIAQTEREKKVLTEEKIDTEFKFLKHLKSVASVLQISDELEDVRTDLVLRTSTARPVADDLSSVSAQVVLDKCEIKNSDLKDYMKFDLDSCDIRDLYYCKNHYKGHHCLQFEKDKNECNNACCLEIKMAECVQTHCLSKKPVKDFQRVANMICTEYADKHVTEGLPPFPQLEEDNVEENESNENCDDGTENQDERSDNSDESGDDDSIVEGDEEPAEESEPLNKRFFGNDDDYDDDVLNNVGESVCEVEEFEPGYDLTKCDKKEVKDCIKEGIQYLLDDPENFCPYCINDNAYDECRCACCFGKYFSKVCYDPNCAILTEKLRYKRYVREVCKTRPVKYLFTRSLKKSSPIKELPAVNTSTTVKKVSVDEYNVLDRKKANVKNHTQKHSKSEQTYDGGFDLFSDFGSSDTPHESDIYFESRPVNVHKESLDEKRKSKLRYNFKLQNHMNKRDEQYLDEYSDTDNDDTHILYVQDGTTNEKVRRSVKPQVKVKSEMRAQSFAKGGSIGSKSKKKEAKQGPERIKSKVKLTTSAKAFGLGNEKTLKKKMPNKPKKTKGSQAFLVDGPKFLDNPNKVKSIKEYERDHEETFNDDHTVPFESINPVSDVSDNDSDENLSQYKNKTPFSLGKSKVQPVRNRSKVINPKLSKRYDTFRWEVLYKRDFDANEIEDDIVEDIDYGYSSSLSEDTSKFRTITRTRKIAAEPTTAGISNGSPGQMVIGALRILSADLAGLNDSFTTTVTQDVTKFTTETSLVTVTTTLPKKATFLSTITETKYIDVSHTHTDVSTKYNGTLTEIVTNSVTTTQTHPVTITSVSSSLETLTRTKTESHHHNSSYPVTVTSIKTRIRPTTLTETESQRTVTVTAPKKVVTKFENTTTTTDTVKVTSTFTKSATKTVANITIIEYEETDKTVTSTLTDHVTLTTTKYDDVSTKTITTFSGTSTTTLPPSTKTLYRKLTEVTKTVTEIEFEEFTKTKWYPKKTVTEYDDGETIFKTIYFPITTTDHSTTTVTTSTTTTLTNTLVDRARPVVSLAQRDYNQVLNEEISRNGSIEGLNLSNSTTLIPTNTSQKGSIADMYHTKNETSFTSESSKLGINMYMIICGIITISVVAVSLYTYTLGFENDEDDEINEVAGITPAEEEAEKSSDENDHDEQNYHESEE